MIRAVKRSVLDTTRVAYVGGIGGPLAFLAGWVTLGARSRICSPVRDPVSALAARGAPSRPAMTVAFGLYAIGVAGYAPRLAALSRPAALAATTNAAAMAAVAALPLGGPGGDGPHVVAAGAAYVSLSMVPLAAARPYRRLGDRRWAALSAAAGAVTAASLVLSLLHRTASGTWQRVGLTAGQAWIAASAARNLFA